MFDIEERKAVVRARYGENRKITGDYDKSLAVKCINGTFVGKKNGSVIEYKGIPYVGVQPGKELRFKAPVPFKEDDGVYEAYYYGKSPCQPEIFSEEASLYVQGEDCLCLNVWKNIDDNSEKKPVMVWIHGGAFEQGGTADPMYDGYNFISVNPDVVFVTITYRVGLFGFMRLDILPDGAEYKDSQNIGLLDEQMALKWIHENIAAFGGDPEKVTIFGESAGGASVTLLPLMKEARKYFKRSIAQSGTPVFTRSTEDSIQVTNEVMEKLGCSTVKELLALPMEKLVEAENGLQLRQWPERDGIVIPKDPYQAYADGEAKDIDFLHGCNKDEVGYFVLCLGDPDTFSAFFTPRYDIKIASMEKEDAQRARKFLDNVPGEQYLKTQRLGEQGDFVAPVFRISENQSSAGGNVYHYFFRVESTVPYVLSGHAVEIPCVLNNRQETALTGRAFDESFARTIQRMWVKFARTGNPSLTAEEAPGGKAIEWKKYTSENKDIMVFDEFDIHTDTESNLKIIDWELTYPLTKYYLW